ncbi:MAG: SPOR domain-containing protein [Terracidiphilus sp.]
MRGAFDDREMEPAHQRRDTELTLSSMTLLGIFFGLVLLCGLCFGLGYSMGHRGAAGPTVALQPEANAQTTLQSDGSHPKPSASEAPPAQPVPTDTTSSTDGTDAGPIPPTGGQPAQNVSGSSATPTQPQVRPALPAAANPAQPGTTIPAVPGAGTLMVQVAAVSNQEDADVLTGALRKRGYPVSERRDAGDGMVHVRIGPFTTRDDANKWRLKLLNDGYNAIVQP